MHKLSICIPTYNRALYLDNCLKWLVSFNQQSLNFDICISDNNSTDETYSVILKYKSVLNIKYKRNNYNIGMAANIISVVDMSDSEFVWLIGDDDFLLPDAINKIIDILQNYDNIDFIYANSLIIDIKKYGRNIFDHNITGLINNNILFSNYKIDGELPFFDLINPNLSFDFLGGIFLSVFRRDMWLSSKHNLNFLEVYNLNSFSSLDNTFPHVKIFASAFCKSNAYFYSKPLTANFSGVREWTQFWPLIKSFRLIECLDEYKKNGLSLLTYIYCKNVALNTFIPDLLLIIINGEKAGRKHLKIINILHALLYPGTYFSIIRPLIRVNFYLRLFSSIKSFFRF
jgi:glycosyltransferase involved in cell wall biosynthesis